MCDLGMTCSTVRKKGTVGVRLQTLRVQMVKLYPQWVIVAPYGTYVYHLREKKGTNMFPTVRGSLFGPFRPQIKVQSLMSQNE